MRDYCPNCEMKVRVETTLDGTECRQCGEPIPEDGDDGEQSGIDSFM